MRYLEELQNLTAGSHRSDIPMNAPAPTELLKQLLVDCRMLLVGTKPYVPIGVGILTDFTNMVNRIDAELVRQAASVGAEVTGEAVDFPTCDKIATFIMKYPYFTGIEAFAIANAVVTEFALASPSRSEGVSQVEVLSGDDLGRSAKIADEFAAYEGTVFDRADADSALTETGRHRVQDRALARQSAAEAIARKIRLLSPSAAQAAQVPAAWLVKWAMKNSGPQASAYLKEDDARRAAKNVEAYSHATGVEVLPVYTAQPLSAPLPHKLPFHDETMDRLDSLTIRTSSVPSASRGTEA